MEEKVSVILQKIVEEEFFSLIEGHTVGEEQQCVVCGGTVHMSWDWEDTVGNRFANTEFSTIGHEPDCFVGMAHAIVKGAKK